MGIKRQIIIILLLLFGCFLHLRSFIAGVKMYQLNKSALKKRQKGETFKEWFLYSRFREEIPKFLLVFYFCVLWIHGIGLAVCVLLYFIHAPMIIGDRIAILLVGGDCLWGLIMKLLFMRSEGPIPYDRWITKIRGQKPKKKKRR